MKTKTSLFCQFAALLAYLPNAHAATLTTLVTFNGNGANPQGGMVASFSTLYGTTSSGGTSNYGTVFTVNTNSTGFTTLYNFKGATYNTNTGHYTTVDGSYPEADLIVSNNILYGTTFSGGASNMGTVFALNTSGDNYSVLHSFTGSAGGANPAAGLLLSSNTLFGTTFVGGTSGLGCVFRMQADGSLFTNIHSFTGGSAGANPQGTLVMSGNTLYGTTYGQGSSHGTVFKVNMDGTAFATLYAFTGGTDGGNPQAGLLLSGGTLYGTASEGGGYFGTVFKLTTNGAGFASYPFSGNAGANPQGGLVMVGNTLYGTTPNGGSNGWGTVYQLDTSGNGFNSIYSFTAGADGETPETTLTVVGSSLFGTTQGDPFGDGTVFGIAAVTPPLSPIPLNIAQQGNQVVLTWSSSSFGLQGTTNLAGSFTNIPGATSPYTNGTSGSQKFFRLRSQ